MTFPARSWGSTRAFDIIGWIPAQTAFLLCAQGTQMWCSVRPSVRLTFNFIGRKGKKKLRQQVWALGSLAWIMHHMNPTSSRLFFPNYSYELSGKFLKHQWRRLSRNPAPRRALLCLTWDTIAMSLLAADFMSLRPKWCRGQISCCTVKWRHHFRGSEHLTPKTRHGEVVPWIWEAPVLHPLYVFTLFKHFKVPNNITGYNCH